MRITTVLTTRRLRLRTWRRGDWQAFHKTCNTPEVMEFLGGTSTLSQIKREVAWNMRHQERHGFSFWVLERKRDRAFIGFCGLIRVGELSSPIHGELEIGWRVRSDMWRRGYAGEAAAAVLDWAKLELSGQSVYARVNGHNEASALLAQQLGMRRVLGGDHTHPADRMRLAVYATRNASERR